MSFRTPSRPRPSLTCQPGAPRRRRFSDFHKLPFETILKFERRLKLALEKTRIQDKYDYPLGFADMTADERQILLTEFEDCNCDDWPLTDSGYDKKCSAFRGVPIPALTPRGRHCVGLSKSAAPNIVVSQNAVMEYSLFMLNNVTVSAMFGYDYCYLYTDSCLLAMVFVYFQRLNLQYNEFDFMVLLFVAGCVEEDIDEHRLNLLPWALGVSFLRKYKDFYKRKDVLLDFINYRTLVSDRLVNTVICQGRSCTKSGLPTLWRRERGEHHAGANRQSSDVAGRSIDQIVRCWWHRPVDCVPCRTRPILVSPRKRASNSSLDSITPCSKRRRSLWPVQNQE